MPSRRYEVFTSAYGTENLDADQLDVDDRGYLRFFVYKEVEGYALPQLTTISVYAQGAWLSVREINKPSEPDQV
jgi:hypothetical protein